MKNKKQQQDASSSQVDNMDILAIEYMELPRNSESYWPILCENRELTKQDSQTLALKVTILTGWPDTKDETHLCIKK